MGLKSQLMHRAEAFGWSRPFRPAFLGCGEVALAPEGAFVCAFGRAGLQPSRLEGETFRALAPEVSSGALTRIAGATVEAPDFSPGSGAPDVSGL